MQVRAHVSRPEPASFGGSVPYVIRAAPPQHYGWLLERTGLDPTGGLRVIECLKEATGRILGQVGYDSWTPNSVHVHVAVDSPAAVRALLPAAFAYPFDEAGRSVLIGVIPAHREKAMHMAASLGFRETHRVFDGWKPGIDLVVFELRKQDWRGFPRKA